MKNIISGLAGALALNLLHETYKRIDKQAPRIDLVGEEAITRITKSIGIKPPKGNDLYTATLIADITSNALYYSLIGAGNNKNLLLKATLLGTAAGVGAVVLTRPLGLHDAPVTRTPKTKGLTILWYVTGALVTAFTIKALKR